MQMYQEVQLRELDTDTSLVAQEDGGGTNMKQRLLEMIRPLGEADIDRIRLVQTPQELLDCSHHFHLHYGADLAGMREHEARTAATAKKAAKKKTARDEDGSGGGDGEDEPDEDDEEVVDEADETTKVVKYASKKDRYHHCKLAGLCSLARKFGLTPEQLGENLECDYQKHEIEQWPVAPIDEAQNYVKEPYFNSPEHVNTSSFRYQNSRLYQPRV